MGGIGLTSLQTEFKMGGASNCGQWGTQEKNLRIIYLEVVVEDLDETFKEKNKVQNKKSKGWGSEEISPKSE